jgi:hypothetical protein
MAHTWQSEHLTSSGRDANKTPCHWGNSLCSFTAAGRGLCNLPFPWGSSKLCSWQQQGSHSPCPGSMTWQHLHGMQHTTHATHHTLEPAGFSLLWGELGVKGLCSTQQHQGLCAVFGVGSPEPCAPR